MRDSMFTETEQAQALREIRARYPAFDMVQFMRLLKADVPLVIKAYLEGDLDVLRQHCAPEMMERFNGIVAAQKAQVRRQLLAKLLDLPMSARLISFRAKRERQ